MVFVVLVKVIPLGLPSVIARKLSVGRTKECVALRLTFFISSGRLQAKRLVRPAEIKNALETKAQSFVLKRDPAGSTFYRSNHLTVRILYFS